MQSEKDFPTPRKWKKNVCNTTNSERKKGFERCKKTLNVEILQTDKDDSSE